MIVRDALIKLLFDSFPRHILPVDWYESVRKIFCLKLFSRLLKNISKVISKCCLQFQNKNTFCIRTLCYYCLTSRNSLDVYVRIYYTITLTVTIFLYLPARNSTVSLFMNNV